MKINGIEIEMCGCCEYCNDLYKCGKIDLNMICCQRDFGDDDRECYRDCRSCMDDFREKYYDDEPTVELEEFIYDDVLPF